MSAEVGGRQPGDIVSHARLLVSQRMRLDQSMARRYRPEQGSIAYRGNDRCHHHGRGFDCTGLLRRAPVGAVGELGLADRRHVRRRLRRGVLWRGRADGPARAAHHGSQEDRLLVPDRGLCRAHRRRIGRLPWLPARSRVPTGLTQGNIMTEVRLGAATATRIEESYEPNFDAKVFFPDWTPGVVREHGSWMSPNHYDAATGWLKLSIHSWLLRVGGKTILIDTCVGNHKSRKHRPKWDMMNTPYLDRLKAAGVTPDQIDMVMCTHMHVDHVGWNTRLDNGRWVPTFPKAKYVFADRELAFWTEKERADPGKQPWIVDSVLPIIQAGRQEVVTSHHELSDVVKLIPTPGHTIDHFSVQVGKPGVDAVIGGDMIHSPIQARYPELAMRADYDRRQGGESRRALFERLCDTATLLCTGHFPSPSKGRL